MVLKILGPIYILSRKRLTNVQLRVYLITNKITVQHMMVNAYLILLGYIKLSTYDFPGY